jgi:hypothetical protein
MRKTSNGTAATSRGAMTRTRAQRINLIGTVSNHEEAHSIVKLPGDTVVVERGRPRALVFKCPCGCGDIVTINLDRRSGKAWVHYSLKGRGLSLYPSVWRDSGCESHFVLWNNYICWFDGDWLNDREEVSQLAQRVIRALPTDTFIHFYDLSAKLHEVPWDVLQACRLLVSDGNASEGNEEARGTFKRICN